MARDETHPILRNRCYGTDVETVVRHGRAVADGLFTGGVLPVMKHIPGHGLGTLDSHKDLPRVGAPRDVLDHTDFAAFRALNDLPLGMTAHLVFEEIDPQPATISEVMVKIIRDEIGSIWQRCGEMTPAAQTRAEAALAAHRAPDDVDIAALEAEFDALTA